MQMTNNIVLFLLTFAINHCMGVQVYNLDIIQVDGHVKIRHKNLNPGNRGWLRNANQHMLFGGFPGFGLLIRLFVFLIENVFLPL